jgi:6-phosphogluconolactonase
MSASRSVPRCGVLSVFVLLGAAVGPTQAGGQPAGETPSKLRVYVGTYTQGTKSQGIYLFDLDPAKGTLTPQGLAGETANPSFLAIHPNRRFLYAVSEVSTSDGMKTGAVAAFDIDPETGKLKLLNKQPSRGAGPCHLVTDAKGKNVLVANYGGGSVAVLPIREDGGLAEPSSAIQHEGKSVNPRRQEAPHAHSINLDAANRFAFAADLGLDKVLVYRFDPAKGTLTANDPAAATVEPGAGPRHFAFHPDGRHAYVINELTSTVTAFSYDPDKGVLKEVQTISTLPEGFKGDTSTAEVQVHPSGKFLYGSNRGHDSISVFTIDPATGKLTLAGHQTGIKTPRNFGIDPTGTYLLAAAQGGNTLTVYRIDPKTGLLKQVGEPAEVPAPVCVKFVPVGK